MSDPLIKMLPKGARGLDFGAGPTSDGRPVLCEILKEAGFECLPYDPYFFPKMPEGAFDFIAASETFEHLRHPREEIEQIYENLKPGGLLGVMTAFWDEALFAEQLALQARLHPLCASTDWRLSRGLRRTSVSRAAGRRIAASSSSKNFDMARLRVSVLG